MINRNLVAVLMIAIVLGGGAAVFALQISGWLP